MILKPPRRALKLITVLSTAWILALPLSSTGQEPKKSSAPVEFDVLFDVGIVRAEVGNRRG